MQFPLDKKLMDEIKDNMKYVKDYLKSNASVISSLSEIIMDDKKNKRKGLDLRAEITSIVEAFNKKK